MKQERIAPQPAASYNRSLASWIPQAAIEAADHGDLNARYFIYVAHRYAKYRRPEDWNTFRELRKEWEYA